MEYEILLSEEMMIPGSDKFYRFLLEYQNRDDWPLEKLFKSDHSLWMKQQDENPFLFILFIIFLIEIIFTYFYYSNQNLINIL